MVPEIVVNNLKLQQQMNKISFHQYIGQKERFLQQQGLQLVYDDQVNYFCYLDIRNQQTLITETVLVFISTVVCIVAVKKYYDIWKTISVRNRNANLTYLGIMIWWLSYIVGYLYSILIYILYNQKQNVAPQLSWFSKLYFSLNWANAFILQTLLIFVPYHWMKRISQALSAVSGNDSESGIQDNLPETGYKGIQSKIYPLLKGYLKVRSLSIIPIILFLILTDFKTISLFSKLMLSILLFDCMIIIFVLSSGIYSLKTNQLLKMQLDKDQSKRLLNQYLIIIFSTGIRFGYDILGVIYGVTQNLTQDDCSLNSQATPADIIMLVLTSMLAHYLPIVIILRIYSVQQQPEDLTKSLIIAD